MRFWKPKAIGGTPRVGIAVAAYLNDDTSGRQHAGLRGLVSAFEAQTYAHKIVYVLHDGPYTAKPEPPDLGCYFTCADERKQQFGHPYRQLAIDRLLEMGCEWIGLTNQGNYYVPTYLEWMLAEAQAKKADFVYCDCVHSHKLWKALPALPRRGKIDLGSFLVHRSLVEKIRFDKFTFAGDWDYISRLLGASKRFAHLAATLFIHN